MSDKISAGVNPLLWWAGWRIKATLGLVTILGAGIGYQLNMPYLLGTLSFMFLSPLGAVLSIWYVNRNYPSVLDGFHTTASDTAEELLSFDEEDNVGTYTLRSGSGSKILRKPNTKYTSATMLVTDFSVTIHDGNELDMISRTAEIADSTEEIYFDQISSVNYTDGEFWINRADGHGHSWESDREPEDALDDIQQRVRDYKRKQVA